MQISVAEARRRFAEVLHRAESGEQVTVTRRGRAVALVGPPPAAAGSADFGDFLVDWHARHRPETWAEEPDPFDAIRGPDPGPTGPW